ncbi:MAG: hypothetical protein PF637_03010 [Spirochaetes bacterium]|jgi:hypothetical protein|nr:hypothetical protein [Spirochaetota bacterium]
METNIFLKTIPFFTIIWGISVAFLIFRPRIPIIWKMAAILLFLFYISVFRSDIEAFFVLARDNWYQTLILFFKETLYLLFYMMFIFWPLSLIIIFYKYDDFAAERLLKFMVFFTIAFWIGIAIYSYNKKGIDDILYNKVIELFPFFK